MPQGRDSERGGEYREDREREEEQLTIAAIKTIAGLENPAVIGQSSRAAAAAASRLSDKTDKGKKDRLDRPF